MQLYWFGFFMAAGHICGHGPSLTLVVTLGDDGRDRINPFLTDLLSGDGRCEFCRSSLVGWQGYLRDRVLCNALIPWGIPSTLYGEDPTILEDLPEALIAPFVRGYVDGSEVSHAALPQPGTAEFAVRGTRAMLAGINALVRRGWGTADGVITEQAGAAELRFRDAASRRVIEERLSV